MLFENHCIMITMECGQDEYIRALGDIFSARCSLRWTTVTSLNEFVKMKRKFTQIKTKTLDCVRAFKCQRPPKKKPRLFSTKKRD